MWWWWGLGGGNQVTYTESGGTGTTTVDQSEAVAVMLEKYEVCYGLFHGFDWFGWVDGA